MKTGKYSSLILFASLLAFPFLSQAQPSDLHRLAKYSYPIFVVSGNQQHTGTAFFYQSADTTYLVSNYHAIKGMNPLKKVINFKADSLFLKYPTKKLYDFKLLAIDISEESTGETEIFSMVDRIDLLKIPIEIPEDADILFINDLIDPDYIGVEAEEIVAFGFPTSPGHIPAFFSRQQRFEGMVNPDGFTDYATSIQINFPSTSDSAKAIMNETSRFYYFIKPFAPQGYSGAPVFGKFRDENNQVIYRFTGVIFAAQPATRQTWAIKGSVALEYLQEEL